jgi:hypothetical protein
MRSPSGPTALLGALALTLGLSLPAAAQEAAEPVPYIDTAGNQLGTILIRDFADPFTEYDPSGPPAEGFRYAMLTLTFEAAEDQAFPTDPYQVQLQDANGFLYYPQWVPRPADAVVQELQAQNLSPFDRVSGVIPYVLPQDVSIVRILYRADGRLMPIAYLGDAGSVAVGEPRGIADAAGSTLGSVTVREVLDPFTAHDPNSPPPEGQRYVMLEMAFEAAEDQAVWANPGSIGLVAPDGTVYWPTWVSRPQPFLLQYLESTPLSPSDRISGVIGFAVPQGVEIDSVVYNYEGNRFLPVVDL